jgi:hypothetical protein
MAKRSRPNASILFGMTVYIIASSSVFAADQPPNIKGKWIGKTYTTVAGSGGHWPTNEGRSIGLAF